jgi:hypothetical protein
MSAVEPVEAPQHATIMDALLAVQCESITLAKDKINPAFRSKYLSLDALMEQVMPALNKHGLLWVTMPVYRPEGVMLRYRLIHASTSVEIEGDVPLILTKQDSQGMGSAITYMRRYTILAVLGLCADEDDEGARASRSNGEARVSSGPAQQTELTATAKQRGLINGKAGEKGLPPIDLANIVLAATESEPRDFNSQSDAEGWLRRAMDRLPAKYIDAILAGIDRADPADLAI